MIWIPNVTPKTDPQFHMYEIEEGAGSSINVEEITLVTGLRLLSLFFIVFSFPSKL